MKKNILENIPLENVFELLWDSMSTHPLALKLGMPLTTELIIEEDDIFGALVEDKFKEEGLTIVEEEGLTYRVNSFKLGQRIAIKNGLQYNLIETFARNSKYNNGVIAAAMVIPKHLGNKVDFSFYSTQRFNLQVVMSEYLEDKLDFVFTPTGKRWEYIEVLEQYIVLVYFSIHYK